MLANVTAGNTAKPLGRLTLSGTIPDMQAGMGVAAFAVPGSYMQNGGDSGGDGFALIKTGTPNRVLQLLSYEGVFKVRKQGCHVMRTSVCHTVLLLFVLSRIAIAMRPTVPRLRLQRGHCSSLLPCIWAVA